MSPLDVAVPMPAAATEAEIPAPPTLSEAEIAGARRFADASRAASTRRAYAADWRRFSSWCTARNAPALPANPVLVAVYLSDLSGRGLARLSVGRALAAIVHMHKRAGLVAPHRGADDAAVAEVLAGIRRPRQNAPDKKLAAAAGLDPARYAGHSLRAGFMTAAACGSSPCPSVSPFRGHMAASRKHVGPRGATVATVTGRHRFCCRPTPSSSNGQDS
jgi:hypothetical protein